MFLFIGIILAVPFKEPTNELWEMVWFFDDYELGLQIRVAFLYIVDQYLDELLAINCAGNILQDLSGSKGLFSKVKSATNTVNLKITS